MKFKEDMSQIPLYGWIVIAVLLFGQGIWIFNDARKRGENAWMWGMWGLLNFPTPLVVYLLVVRKVWKRPK